MSIDRARSVVGLFAGIGGIEVGLSSSGFEAELLCDIDPGAEAVLRQRFEDVPFVHDVRDLESLPACTILSAGFPCQDLSQAGRAAGIEGRQSGLVSEIFRLLDVDDRTGPEWLLLENVPFMLQLEAGRAMRFLTDELGKRGFRWAYRVVDARAFGVPQRRRRVLLLASRTRDPRPVLFGEDAGAPNEPGYSGRACGFYWTEGNRGLGWAVDAVPTLKGGSGLGIPSPPAIWMPDGGIVTPDIRDAERLQGFAPNWTLPAVEEAGLRVGARWKLVGNAVCVPMAAWLGERIVSSDVENDWRPGEAIGRGERWPPAAWGVDGTAEVVEASEWPVVVPRPALTAFLEYEPKPLSARATRGFRDRLARSSLSAPEEFRSALDRALETSEADAVLSGAR